MDIPDLSGEMPGGAQAATGCSSQALAVGAPGGPVPVVAVGSVVGTLWWAGIQWGLATGDYHRKMEVLMGKPEENHRKMEVYPLVNIQKLWKITIFNG